MGPPWKAWPTAASCWMALPDTSPTNPRLTDASDPPRPDTAKIRSPALQRRVVGCERELGHVAAWSTMSRARSRSSCQVKSSALHLLVALAHARPGRARSPGGGPDSGERGQHQRLLGVRCHHEGGADRRSARLRRACARTTPTARPSWPAPGGRPPRPAIFSSGSSSSWISALACSRSDRIWPTAFWNCSSKFLTNSSLLSLRNS